MIHLKRHPDSYSWENDGTPYVFVTTEEITELTDEVIRQVLNSEYKPDLIVSIAQSGVSLGIVVARVFDIPHAIFQAKAYSQGADNQSESKHHVLVADGSLFIDKKQGLTSLPLFLKPTYQRLLLVDHLVDSGDTMIRIMKTIRTRYSGDYFINTACLYQKVDSQFVPNFVGAIEYPEAESKKLPWIVTPTEAFISHLRQKYNLTSNLN